MIIWPDFVFPPINLLTMPPRGGGMSIVTKTGDGGKTDGPKGTRVSKDGYFTEIVGTLDELNAVLGISRKGSIPIDVRDFVKWVQHMLLDIGAGLYLGEDRIKKAHIMELESFVYDHEPALDTFILPSNELHLARAVCRRLERAIVAYHMFEHAMDPNAIKFINRLSDALYAAAIAASTTLDKWESQK